MEWLVQKRLFQAVIAVYGISLKCVLFAALQAMVRVCWNIYRIFFRVKEHNIPFRIFLRHMISKGQANTKHLHLILWLKPPHNCTTGRQQRKLGQEWKQSHINYTMTSADWLIADVALCHCFQYRHTTNMPNSLHHWPLASLQYLKQDKHCYEA